MPLFPALATLFKGAVGKAIIGNVATAAINGIASRQQAKADRAQSLGDVAEQYVRLREAAEAGGFNPLTVLRAGGSGMPNPTPALASGKFVTDALGAGVQTFFNGDQIKRDAERDMLERALMREELRAMQAQGRAVTRANMRFGFEIPTANNYSGVDRAAASYRSSGSPTARGLAGEYLIMPWGAKLPVDSGSAAQEWSDEYGDLVESAVGAGKLGGDGFRWLDDWMNTPRAKTFSAPRHPVLKPSARARVIPNRPEWLIGADAQNNAFYGEWGRRHFGPLNKLK